MILSDLVILIPLLVVFFGLVWWLMNGGKWKWNNQRQTENKIK
jgi:hypothetical protein